LPGCKRLASEETGVGRLLPEQLHVADPRGSVDEVEWAVADDLVGDVDATALGVPGLGLHERQLAPALAPPSTAADVAHTACNATWRDVGIHCVERGQSVMAFVAEAPREKLRRAGTRHG
jgi:hypothetical protein